MKTKQFVKTILEWSSNNLCSYPWRENRDPYKILVSEILLIRTKATQVVDIYREFLTDYPNIESLAKAEKKSIKSIIKSLGLIFRAEILNTIAKEIKHNYSGNIPDNYQDLINFKGIGKYTANAILCFGFNKKRPLVDSNFIRIFKRALNITSKTKTAKNDKFLWNFAEKILPKKDYILYNYGMIDLGGQICLPKSPQCEICPVNYMCYYNNN